MFAEVKEGDACNKLQRQLAETTCNWHEHACLHKWVAAATGPYGSMVRWVHVRMCAFTWLPAITIDSVIVTAAKLAGNSALASGPLAGGTEGAAPQPPLLSLSHTSENNVCCKQV